jgi:type IV pilus biogenesis protein CpaD/CtpE
MNDPMNGNSPDQLHAAVGMLTELQGRLVREIRQAVESLGVACQRIEVLDPGSTSLEELAAAVVEFQQACALTDPCLQKLKEVAGRYGG